MKPPVFYGLLKNFSEEELDLFRNFVKSPYFNTRGSLIKLFELTEYSIRKNDIGELSKQKISACIKRDKKNTSDASIRRLMSDFTALIYSFLTIEEIKSNEHLSNMQLAESLRKKGQITGYKQKLKAAFEKLEGSERKDEEFYRNKILLLNSQQSFEGEYNLKSDSFVDRKINNALDNYFIISKINQFEDFWSKQYIKKEKTNYNWTFFDDIKKYIEINSEEIKLDHPEIYLRYRMLILLLNPEEKYIIDECLSYIQEKEKSGRINLSSYYIDILNLCSLMVNAGDTSYNAKIVRISKDMESGKVWDKLMNYGYVPAKIVIESAIVLKEYQWAQSFTGYISSKIQPEYKNSFINLMLAKIYTFSRDFDNARLHQSKVHYEDFIFYTDAKGLEARIEFETENYVRAVESIESLKKYLKAHKRLPERWSKSYNKFAELLSALIKYMEKKDYSEFTLAMIESEIRDSEYFIYAQEWLTDKINDIRNSQKKIHPV